MKHSFCRSPLLLVTALFLGGASVRADLVGQPILPEGPLTLVGNRTLNLGTFGISIVAGPLLSMNMPALDAFNRAADRWESRISDPITVSITADLAPFNEPGVLGSANTVILQASYTTIRNQMVMDSADEADDGIVSFLPTAAMFQADVPTGALLSGNVALAKANAKALGFTGLDAAFGPQDGTITFNSNFGFDFDNRDGVGAGLFDFESVALHEIGHTLGFFSAVDDADGGSLLITPITLDLFRFAENVPLRDPSTPEEFATFPRNLQPGVEAVTDDIDDEYRMSTGLTQGDGRQASHWKDNTLTGTMIGTMDPTLAPEEIFLLTDADFRAMDLIGYEVVSDASVQAIPEPGTWITAMLLVAVCFRHATRRRQVARA